MGWMDRVGMVCTNCITAIEASKMVGKLARLAEGAPWVCFLVSQFYASIAHALAQNKTTLEKSSFEFQELSRLIKNKSFKATSKINREKERLSDLLSRRQQECSIMPQ